MAPRQASSWSDLWSLITTFLPFAIDVVRLFRAIADYAEAQRWRNVGREEAIAAGLRRALQDIAEAREAELEAEKAHRYNPDSDDAFLDDFRRR